MSLDHVNAAFEGIGSVLLWLNVVQARRDRRMRGVSPWPAVFFSLWGAWNLFSTRPWANGGRRSRVSAC